ncbi:(Fe-S)-binding protein [Parapedobacter soli]|uniref:(Fe-S)-binding protein n=1 Tax=Parapedobacter soli TaxID=416955 RepID=UPI0021C68C7C|nr:(Fe-S)-binding protein [Parapedobacter soli]
MKIQLFVPCFVDQLFPDTAFNMVSILEGLGCEVCYNPEQTCCGQPAFNAGFRNDCRAVAEKFIGDFNAADPIVAPSGSCTGFVRNYYGQLFQEEGPGDGEILPIQKQVYEFSEFLVDVLGVTNVGAALHAKATYHDACGALRECGIKDAPRKLLQKVLGLELVEAADCEVCCGFGGTFAVKFEPISTSMAEQKVVNAMKLGAEYIISTDSSCLMQLDAYIRKHKCNIKVMHIADVLASRKGRH